jgi:hypothetical protein
LGPTTRCVVGRKYNVTAALQPYLLKRFKARKPPVPRSTPVQRTHEED